MGNLITVIDGCAFDPDIASCRFANFMRTNALTTRAQFLTFWAGLTTANQTKLIIDLLAGALRFPDDPAGATPQSLALLAVP